MAFELPEARLVAGQLACEITGQRTEKIALLGSACYLCPACQPLPA